ncbi:MAG: flagellar protein FlaG [bacterium]|nr:flagellar protein FlaG [bacterium]
MIENIGQENLTVNKAGEAGSTRPPSSQEVSKSSETSQAAVEVDLRSDVARDVNKSSERAAGSQKSDQSLEEDLRKTIDALNEKLSGLNRQVLFKVDKRINRNYISVIDKESQEVIREFPPKDIRAYIARFDQFNEKLNSSSDVKSLIINLEV